MPATSVLVYTSRHIYFGILRKSFERYDKKYFCIIFLNLKKQKLSFLPVILAIFILKTIARTKKKIYIFGIYDPELL